MTAPPWLFDGDSFANLSEPTFANLALAKSGQIAKAIFNNQKLDLMQPPLEEAVVAQWQAALAAEALLLTPDKREEPVFSSLAPDCRPCGPAAPTYGELKQCLAAAALFPLASANKKPLLARMWAFKGVKEGTLDAWPFPLTEADRVLRLAQSQGVMLVPQVPSDVSINGASWQLAARLAMRALEDAVQPRQRLDLAANWIITGALDGEQVVSVEFGDKLQIVTRDDARKWLYPECDKSAFDARVEELRQQNGRSIPSHACSTVEAAWRIVCGYGTRPEDDQEWPAHITTMHALVGGSIAANLASFLFSPIEELHLWHSYHQDKSKDKAEELRGLLQSLPSLAKMKIELHELPSQNLVAAEEALQKYLTPTGQQREPIYVNITSGNRLMALAVDRWARDNSNIRLIYRDFDAEDLAYVAIWHDSGVPHTCVLHPQHLTENQKSILRQILNPVTPKTTELLQEWRSAVSC